MSPLTCYAADRLSMVDNTMLHRMYTHARSAPYKQLARLMLMAIAA